MLSNGSQQPDSASGTGRRRIRGWGHAERSAHGSEQEAGVVCPPRLRGEATALRTAGPIDEVHRFFAER